MEGAADARGSARSGSDCTTGYCEDRRCASPTCSDGVQIRNNSSYIEVGIGVTGTNADYRDAQSAAPGAHDLDRDEPTSQEDYAIFVR